MQHKDPQLMEKIRLYAMNYYREHNQMPSIRTIADGTGMNRGSVQKYLVEMQERGIILRHMICGQMHGISAVAVSSKRFRFLPERRSRPFI